MTRAMLVLFVLCLGAVGCTLAVTPPPAGTYLPTLAASHGVAASSGAAPAPNPNPVPNPDNPPGPAVCPTCNGKGWNGDGTIRNKCEPCDGTGWLNAMGESAAPPVGFLLQDVEDLKQGQAAVVERLEKIEERLKEDPELLKRLQENLEKLEAIQAEQTERAKQADQEFSKQADANLANAQQLAAEMKGEGPKPLTRSQYMGDKFEGWLLQSQMEGKPLLVIVRHPHPKSYNDKIKKTIASVPGIRERFIWAQCDLKDMWDATTTVGDKLGLPKAYTSLVIAGPGSRTFIPVERVSDLKDSFTEESK